MVCPEVLSCSDLTFRQRIEVKNISKPAKIMLQFTLNPDPDEHFDLF